MRHPFVQLIAVVLAMSFVMSSCGGIGSSADTVEVVGPNLVPRSEAGLPVSSATPDLVDEEAPAVAGEGFVLNLPGSENAPGPSFFSSAATQLETADSYRFEMSVGMDIGDLSARLHIPEGTVLATGGYVDGRTLTKMDMGPMFGSVDNLGDVEEMFGSDLTMDMLVDAETAVMYLRAPWIGELAAVAAQEAGGATQLDPLLALQDGWVRMDANLLGGNDMASLAGGQMGSAEGMADLLSDVGATVEDLGSTVIRDTPAQHLRATTSLLAMMEAQGQEGSLQALSLEESLFQDVDIPFEVWLDEDGRLLRLEMSMDLVDVARAAGEKLPAGTRAEYSMRFDVFDYNDPRISITLPTQDVVDVTMAFLALTG